jgi:hypothetical protein
MNINKKEITSVLKENNWAFFNSLLYKMCSEHFEHKNVDVVMAKVCIIGRAYSVSIERRKIKGKKITSDGYYEKIVAPAIIDSDIDKWLSFLKRFKTISEENLPDILKTHLKVMKLFNRISGMDKRSLTSKYLHFHLPDLFYIYDSRAVKGLRLVLPGFRVKNKLNGYDEEYSKFCQKLFYLQEKIGGRFGKKLTTRQLDRLLLLKS